MSHALDQSLNGALAQPPLIAVAPGSTRPRLSVVFAVHDPEYGGGLLARTQKHLDAFIELSNHYRLRAEIIIVEWNPRPDRLPFRELLRWPDQLGSLRLRFLEVPAAVHRSMPNADRMPMFEYIAKNAGLRRARGQFLLATNPDLFYAPALVRWLSQAPLSRRTFYRVDRRDLSDDIPGHLALHDQVRFCRAHVAEVHALFGSYAPRGPHHGTRPDNHRRRLLQRAYERHQHETGDELDLAALPDARLVLPADGLHRNAAGDFFLMERSCWRRLRGYPEIHTHAHVDAILCWVASSAGLEQCVLPARCHLYHQVHHRASHQQFSETDWRPWYERYVRARQQGRRLAINGSNWGLAREHLPEWEAKPILTFVDRTAAPPGHST
jgi:hypothetical protein